MYIVEYSIFGRYKNHTGIASEINPGQHKEVPFAKLHSNALAWRQNHKIGRGVPIGALRSIRIEYADMLCELPF